LKQDSPFSYKGLSGNQYARVSAIVIKNRERKSVRRMYFFILSSPYLELCCVTCSIQLSTRHFGSLFTGANNIPRFAQAIPLFQAHKRRNLNIFLGSLRIHTDEGENIFKE